MWAYVENGQVMVLYSAPVAITVNEIHYPRDIFTKWSGEDLEAIGIYPVVTDPAPPSEPHSVASETLAFDAATSRVVRTRTYTILPTPVPQSVTNWQARAILMTLPGNPGPTLYDDINAALTAMGGAEYAAWEYANDFTRHGALLTAMAAQFGLTETQLDDLFIQAKALEA